MITQVVERHLLQGLHSIFNWVKVNRMGEGTVVAIAAENKVTRDKRMALKAKKVTIEEARDICANLAMRKELRTVSSYLQCFQVHSWGGADDAIFSTATMNQITRKRAPMKRNRGPPSRASGNGQAQNVPAWLEAQPVHLSSRSSHRRMKSEHRRHRLNPIL